MRRTTQGAHHVCRTFKKTGVIVPAFSLRRTRRVSGVIVRSRGSRTPHASSRQRRLSVQSAFERRAARPPTVTDQRTRRIDMRHYQCDSPEAAARIVAACLLSDGHVGKDELEVLERHGIEQRLSLRPRQFLAVVQTLCEDLTFAAYLNWGDA